MASGSGAGFMELMDLGRKVRLLRGSERLEDLAARAGLSRSMVGEVEAGSRDSVRLSTLEAIAKATGTRLVVEIRTRAEESDLARFLDTFLGLSEEDRVRVLRYASLVAKTPISIKDGTLVAMEAFTVHAPFPQQA